MSWARGSTTTGLGGSLDESNGDDSCCCGGACGRDAGFCGEGAKNSETQFSIILLFSMWAEQQEFIKNEVQADIESRPLVSERMTTRSLVEEYAGADVLFQKKTLFLSRRYRFIYFIRRDGNCFIRAFCLGVLLHLLRSPSSERSRVMNTLQSLLSLCVSQGYEEWLVEDFHEALLEEAKKAVEEGATEEGVVERARSAETSEWCVMLLRCVAGAKMMEAEERYGSFVGADVKTYVKQEVEPMGKESEETSIMALCEAVGLKVKIEYLDLSGDAQKAQQEDEVQTNSHLFPLQDAPEQIAFTLLYRPGHFDLLIE